MRYYQKGISLVELSIVLAVMGILLAGTLGGMSVLKASKLRRITVEFNTYIQATEQFLSEYTYLPGDIPTASSYWSGANNGDGDMQIDWDGALEAKQEDLYVWEHLGNSGLVPGTYTGDLITADTIRYGLDVNHPKSEAYNDMGFVFYNLPATVYSRLGLALEAATLTADGLPDAGGLMAKDAYSIDIKMDDGKAAYGRFFAYKEVGASGCASADYTAATATYDLGAADKTCQLLYFYKQAPRN